MENMKEPVIYQQTPWHRGYLYMPEFYEATYFIASYCVFKSFMFFGIIFVIVGVMLTVFSRNNFNDQFHIIGPIVLSIGIVFLLGATSVCLYALRRVKKEVEDRQQQIQTGVNSVICTVQPYIYPQQPNFYPEVFPYFDKTNQPLHDSYNNNHPSFDTNRSNIDFREDFASSPQTK